MNSPSTPELHARVSRKDEVPWKVLDDTIVILDLTEGDFFELDDVGCWIWQRLDGVRTLEDHARALAEEYGIDIETARSDIVAFVADLDSKGLIVFVA